MLSDSISPKTGDATPNINTYGLTDLGYKIFLDRYAYKDMTRQSLKEGDVVIAILSNDRDMSGKREVSVVTKIDGNQVTVVTSHGTEHTLKIELIDKPLETNPEQMFARIASGVASVEKPRKRQEWTEKFQAILSDWKFVPGGRILASAGTGEKLSGYNCFSGETKVQTIDGLFPIKELVGKTVMVLSQGGVYREAEFKSFGEQKLYRIELSYGDVIYATAGHEWVVTNSHGGYSRVTTLDLENKKIPLVNNSSIYVSEDEMEEWKEGIQYGYAYGDGVLRKNRNTVFVPSFTEDNKKYVAKYYSDHNVTYREASNSVVAHGLPATYKSMPDWKLRSNGFRIGFISGLIAADGHVDRRGSVMFHQSDLNAIQEIRDIASSVGIASSSITLVRETNPYNGEIAPNYKLQFTKPSFSNFDGSVNRWLITREDHINNWKSISRKKQASQKIVSVTETDRFEEVFCAIEPETHSFVIESGYLTGNCFVITSPEDSRGGIFKALAEMAEIMSRGGGVGINVSTLRPQYSYVKGVNGRSSGSVSWADLYSVVTGKIEQGGSRRGALMIILNDWHPDLLTFINSKKDMTKITNANISVGISDAFMNAVKEDKDWTFKFPDTSFEKYDTEWDGNFEKWVEKGYPVKDYETMPARQIWDTIITAAWTSAEPGLWFRDRANQNSNSYYYEKGYLCATNPCVTGDTRLHTQYGLVKVEDLHKNDLQLEVTVDNRVYDKGKGVTTRHAVPVFQTDSNADVWKVTTDKGYEIKATSWHELYTNNGKKKLKDITVGDTLWIQSDEGQFGTFHNPDAALIMGLVAGDGHFHDAGDRIVIGLWNELIDHADDIAAKIYNLVGEEQVNNREYSISPIKIKEKMYRIQSVRLKRYLAQYGFVKETKQVVPEVIWQGDKETVVSYIKALFETDGTVNISSYKQSGSIRLSQSNQDFLKEIQILLGNFGVFSSVLLRRKETDRLMPDGHGGKKLYHTKDNYELIIQGESARRFMAEIGFMTDIKNSKWNNWASDKVFKKTQKFETQITSIEYIGKHPVYDTTQPDGNAVIFNSIVSGQCAEEPLPANGVCNLGAINLSKFALEPFYTGETPSENVNWELLREVIHGAVRFLDNVIDYTYYVSDNVLNQQMNERRIGLGIMGLAELMIRCNARYGSEDGIQFTEDIFKFMAEESYRMSAAIALEKGSFTWFEADKFLASGFASRMSDEIKSLIKTKGMRNVTTLTVAPTGSIGTMMNTSTGIEPYFSWKWYRQGRLGYHEENADIVRDYIERNSLSVSDSDNPSDYLSRPFVTAMELNPYEHVAVMAAAQKWNDSSISKTVNCPNEWSIEETADLYMYMYDTGSKGGTIYRDGSRNEQVLHLKKEEKKEDAQTQTDNHWSFNYNWEAVKAGFELWYLTGFSKLPSTKDVAEYLNLGEDVIQDLKIAYELFEYMKQKFGEQTADEKADQMKAAFIQWRADVLQEKITEPFYATAARITGEKIVAPKPKNLSFRKRPEILTGKTFKAPSPTGTVYITVNEDESGYPFEVFVTIGKAGTDIHGQAETIGRFISTGLQMLPAELSFEGLKKLVAQMSGIGGSRSIGMGPNRVLSLQDAIARAIEANYIAKWVDKANITISINTTNEPQTRDEIEQYIQHLTEQLNRQSSITTSNGTLQARASGGVINSSSIGLISSNGNGTHLAEVEKAVAFKLGTSHADICPECHNLSLIRTEGCQKCELCGHAEC